MILNHRCESLSAFTDGEEVGEREGELNEQKLKEEEGGIVETVRFLCSVESGE